MDSKLQEVMNQWITQELYSAYVYIAMAAYADAQSLEGLGHWMKMQSQEELSHAMKFFTFLNDRGCKVAMNAIDKPPADFSSMKDVFEKTLAHEQMVSKGINDLYALAQSVNDTATMMFLQWFVTEQVEEEKVIMDILGKLNFLKGDSYDILMFDKDLAARLQPTFSPVTQ